MIKVALLTVKLWQSVKNRYATGAVLLFITQCEEIVAIISSCVLTALETLTILITVQNVCIAPLHNLS